MSSKPKVSILMEPTNFDVLRMFREIKRLKIQSHYAEMNPFPIGLCMWKWKAFLRIKFLHCYFFLCVPTSKR